MWVESPLPVPPLQQWRSPRREQRALRRRQLGWQALAPRSPERSRGQLVRRWPEQRKKRGSRRLRGPRCLREAWSGGGLWSYAPAWHLRHDRRLPSSQSEPARPTHNPASSDRAYVFPSWGDLIPPRSGREASLAAAARRGRVGHRTQGITASHPGRRAADDQGALARQGTAVFAVGAGLVGDIVCAGPDLARIAGGAACS